MKLSERYRPSLLSQVAGQRAVRVLVEAHAGGDEPAHLFGAFTGENIHGLRFA